jgi:hypothetical protein
MHAKSLVGAFGFKGCARGNGFFIDEWAETEAKVAAKRVRYDVNFIMFIVIKRNRVKGCVCECLESVPNLGI